MSEAKFTPGPWTVIEDNAGNGSNIATGTVRIAHTAAVRNPVMLHGREPIEEAEAKANARLIAAAPEMYAALEAIKGAAKDTNSQIGTVRARAYADIARWCDAALAKATP